ncbi:MAG TPA: SCO family protein [Stellaceae bacterium]|nr:SCO family protein [Stellaceae bacterium]
MGRVVARRDVARGLAVGLCLLALGGCDGKSKWHAIDITGSLPPLAFAMTRASDGKAVTAADYRGSITMVYFGYTNCPDVCPTTLANIAEILKRLGPAATRVRVLFVTIDPNRDSLADLKSYAAAFAPQIDGLRGTEDAIAALARRYRVVYSVEPATKDHPYEVTHSAAVYVFDSSGAARLLVPSLESTTPDIAGTVADLKRLIDENQSPGFITRIMRMV